MSWLLLGWVACGGRKDPADSEPQDTAIEPLPFEPQSGRYTVIMAPKFSGDCALDDPSSGSIVADTWDLLIEGDQIRMWQNAAPSTVGVMDGLDFYFALGTSVVDYKPHAIDAVEVIVYSLSGTFDSATTFAGTYDIAASCEGSECAKIGAYYGSAFTYPCVATAPFEGAPAAL